MAGTKRQKSHYTEVEAAEELGITVTEFRDLIRNHVISEEEALRNVPRTAYQASDLLFLKLRMGKPLQAQL